MTAAQTERNVAERLMPGLERRLKAEVAGGVHFDRFSRGRYATDASHYQIMPLGVVDATDDRGSRTGGSGICRAEGVPVTPRGGGSSQAGQTVNSSVIVAAPSTSTASSISTRPAAAGRAGIALIDNLNRQAQAAWRRFLGRRPTASRDHRRHDSQHLRGRRRALRQPEERHLHRRANAHASVGCLHVRPILNLRLDKDVKAMRAIAEQAFAFVREYKGSHSGEHGDGIVRSEFHEFMFGKRLVCAFEEVKDRFDPVGIYNPCKIVRAPKFDDKTNFRYGPNYHAQAMTTQLDWSAYPGAGGGFQGAVEMCNNNGACRAAAGGVMCPSYRVTREERDVTRGRANSLRLAITGQLGTEALTSDEMAETLKLCVSCKGCRRECPTGVDMAKMKIEVQAARAEKYGLSLHDPLVGYLPRYAPYAAKLPWLLNLRDGLPGAAKLSEDRVHHPGIEAREPERTDTSSGFSMSPSSAPTDSPTSFKALSICGFTRRSVRPSA